MWEGAGEISEESLRTLPTCSYKGKFAADAGCSLKIPEWKQPRAYKHLVILYTDACIHRTDSTLRRRGCRGGSVGKVLVKEAGGLQFDSQCPCNSQMWWCVPAILELRKQRQEEAWAFLADRSVNSVGLSPIERLCLKK